MFYYLFILILVCSNAYNQKKIFKTQMINNVENTFKVYPPRKLNEYNTNGILSWYPIGFDNNFKNNKPYQITICDINYIIWKDKTNKYYGLRDSCSHQGSSFKLGKTHTNIITCPYHGYIYSGINGSLINIPKMKHIHCENQIIDSFKIINKGNMIYLNTIPNLNVDDILNPDLIYIEPEFKDQSHKILYLERVFEHAAKLVTVNSLDISHIGFVHSFGNRQQPNPCNNFTIIPILKENYNGTINHYKTQYEYISGKKSIVNRVYKFNKIIVENEYILPHSTVARVLFGNWSSTIITHSLPISKFKTRLFVKAYRNYLYYNLKNEKIDFMYPFKFLVNSIGDYITKVTMIETINQDKEIVDNIDKLTYESMHGRFSIINDMLSDHYKENYQKIYE